MIILPGVSHLDHGITDIDVRRDFILEKFGKRDAFFIETVELPTHCESVFCGLYGPRMSDPPITEDLVRYVVRNDRKGASRIIKAKDARPSRLVTVIAGPHEEHPCILYTAFGGPPGEKEVWDPSIKSFEELEKCRAFWAEHALAGIG